MVLVGCEVFCQVFFSLWTQRAGVFARVLRTPVAAARAVIETIRVRTKAEKLKLIVLSSHQVELRLFLPPSSPLPSESIKERGLRGQSQCSPSAGPPFSPV